MENSNFTLTTTFQNNSPAPQQIFSVYIHIYACIYTQETSEYYDCLYAPYIQGFSEKLQKDLKSLNVGVAFKTTKTLFCMVCKLRPKREVDDQKNVV